MTAIDWLPPTITGVLTLANLWALARATKAAVIAKEWALEAEESARIAAPIRCRINAQGGLEFDDDAWQRLVDRITEAEEDDE